MGGSKVVDVRREVKRRGRRVAGALVVFLMFVVGVLAVRHFWMPADNWQERFNRGSMVHIEVGEPDEQGCCRVIATQGPDRSMMEMFDRFEREGTGIVRVETYFSAEEWTGELPIVDLPIRIGRRIDAFFDVYWLETGKCTQLTRACIEPYIRAAFGEMNRDQGAALEHALATFAVPSFYRASWEGYVFEIERRLIARWMLSLLLVLMFPVWCVALWRRIRGLKRWRSLERGGKACPRCRYELVQRDGGVSLCPECGLWCSGVGDGVIEVRSEVWRRGRCVLVVGILALFLFIFGVGLTVFKWEEGAKRFARQGEYKVEIVDPDSSSYCCRVVGVTPVYAGEAHSALAVVRTERILHHYVPLLSRLFDVPYGRELNLRVISNTQFDACMQTLPPNCRGEFVQELVSHFEEPQLPSITAMLRARGSNSAEYTHATDEPWRMFISIATWVTMLFGVAVIVWLILLVTRVKCWKQLVKGNAACPNCRCELMRGEDGVLRCSECGLKCRVGEG